MKAMGSGEIDAAVEMRRQVLQIAAEAFSFFGGLERIVRRHYRNDLPFREGQEIFKPEMAFAFGDLGFFAIALAVMAGLDPAIQLY